MDANGFAHTEKQDRAHTRPAHQTAEDQTGRSHKAQQNSTIPAVKGAPNDANNEQIDRLKAARQNISMLNKSALERAVHSALKDNGITSSAKRELLTRAVVAAIDEAEDASLESLKHGRSTSTRDDYDRLRKINFAKMKKMTPEMLPIARRLLTVDGVLRKSGASEEVLGDRKQVKAAGRLVSQFQREQARARFYEQFRTF
jgi:hypothetical protein